MREGTSMVANPISNRQSVFQIIKAASSDIISSLSGDIFSFALSLMLLHTTHSAISFGLGSVIYPIIGFLLVVPLSNLVDTNAHKPLILGAKLVALSALVLYTLTIDHLRTPLWASVAIVTVFGICDKLSQTGYTASVHELVNPEHIKPLTTIEQSASAGIQLLSPLLAALLYTLIGFDGVLRIEMLAETLVILITLSMRFHPQPRTTSEAATNGQWRQFKVGLTYIHQHSVLFFIVQLAVGLNFLFSAINVGIPFALVQRLQLGNTRLGWVMSAFAAGMLVGNLALMVLPTFKRLVRTVLLMTAGLAVTFLVMGVFVMGTWTMVAVTVGMAAMCAAQGLFMALINTPTSVYLQSTVPTELLGRVSGTMMTLNTLAMPLGTLLFSWLFQFLPATPIFVTSGGLILILVLVFWQRQRDGVTPVTEESVK